MLRTFTAAVASFAASVMAQDMAGTGMEMLFSTPGAELPDVYLSKSVVFLDECTLDSDGVCENESGKTTYTVVLTHPPGMREDETIDLDNDEVRIYLTSSQEHFQQDDSAGAVQFEQRRNHRTQLVIYTNDVNGDGALDTAVTTSSTAGAVAVNPAGDTAAETFFSLFGSEQTTAWKATEANTLPETATGDAGLSGVGGVSLPLGPLPYVYKTYSTVGGNVPNQQSPLGGQDGSVDPEGNYLARVCPVCTHPAYCVMYDGTNHDLVTGTGDGSTALSSGALPCENDQTNAADFPANGGCTDNDEGAGVRIIPGSIVTEAEFNTAGGEYAGRPEFQGCYQIKVLFAPVMDECATDPDVVVSDLNPLSGACTKLQAGFTVYDGLLPRQAGGSHPEAVGWSYESPVPLIHTQPGNSDFRIDEIGDQILRTRADPRPLCRYSNCPELTVNGGDQQPESRNFLQTDYECEEGVACGGSWRGDLSSSAQLVFDSTNWNVPQTVQIEARADDVYEPEVNDRGQDAYVHHFVVAQDINLEHTYYDDIEVNDLTVSITDDDPAVVIESLNDVVSTEGGDDAEIKLRLASEPMYPVTVYLQSGSFFDTDSEPLCTGVGTDAEECNFKPDDEQVIFQDKYQYDTCWTTDSTLRTYTYPLVHDQPSSYRATAADFDHGGTFNYQGCFENADSEYVLVDAPIDLREPSPATRQIPATMQCHGDDRCTLKDVNLPNGAYPRDNYHESREAVVPTSTCKIASCSLVSETYDEVGHFVSTGQITGPNVAVDDDGYGTSSATVGEYSTPTVEEGTATRTCKNDGVYLSLRSYGSSGASVLPTTGYTCNSYVTFSTTNWNTWQTLKVIGVNDNFDEGEYRISEIGFLYESMDWYYNSPGASLITFRSLAYQPQEDGSSGPGGTPSQPVSLSMFDTRFGKHINRYPRTAGADDLTAPYSGADQVQLNADATQAAWIAADSENTDKAWEGAAGAPNVYQTAAGGSGAYYGTPAEAGAPCHSNSGCVRQQAFHDAGTDAANLVCCCEVPGGVGTTLAAIVDDLGHASAESNMLEADPSASTNWVSGTPGYISYTSESSALLTGSEATDPLQVQTFAPSEYANRNVQCGAIVTVNDDDSKGVSISRTQCEATEGRRFWFDTFQQEPTPMECDMDGRLYSLNAAEEKVQPMQITLGLFTAERVAATADVDANKYLAPSYASFEDALGAMTDGVGSALPSTGSIQGSLENLCVTASIEDDCVASDPSCSDAGVDLSGLDSETDQRWACESVDGIYTAGNKFWSSADGGLCYAEVANAEACDTGTFVASNNAVTVNTGRIVDANGVVGSAPGDGATSDDTASTTASFSDITCPSMNADGWTMTDWPDSEYRGMTAPVCPYTIVLTAAPLEGATVVVHLRENFEVSNLQDHELFFYEEASYRPGVAASQCIPSLYPGSSWVNGGCFIHNVPVDAYNVPVPRGNTDLDVMFTDADWNVPRRITTVALNDDVDEPTQLRKIFHTVSSCPSGSKNHNNDEACLEDPTFTGISVDTVEVIVVDDDIADLVVIGDDGYVCKAGKYNEDGSCSESEPNIIDENFIGSYDAAGPRLELTVNFWYQAFERQGPYAEDGISGSNFQGRSTTHSTATAFAWANSEAGVWSPATPATCITDPDNSAVDVSDQFTTQAACENANGNPDVLPNVWTDAIPASCSNSNALTQAACETAASSWPLIDPGNDGGLYSSGDSSEFTLLAGHGAQKKDDGIGAGGFRLLSRTGVGSDCTGCDSNLIDAADQASITGGYITDNEDPLCLDPDPLKQDDRCFRIDNKPWTNYDPYWDIYTDGGTPYDSKSDRNTFDACTPVGQPSRIDDGNDDGAGGLFLMGDDGEFCAPGRNDHKQPNRGFKGVGPAYSEPEDEFAVTIHSRECRHDTLGDAPASWDENGLESGWTHGTQTAGADAYRAAPGDAEPGAYSDTSTSSDDHDCIYGSFKVRLNSSPGTKHVRRRYVGESLTVLEEELIQIVVTPDVTAQTMFDPVSVTFTHTGGEVNGVDTFRWDEPAVFKVVPVDDEVDERAGATIDFTSFSVTQSHLDDAYWTYTNSYQTTPLADTHAVGSRDDDHTSFRHHIRTIHTHDNDFAGVTIESGMSLSDLSEDCVAGSTGQFAHIPGLAWGEGSEDVPPDCTSNVNVNSHGPVSLSVVEGESFAYYTMRLDTQPRKVQRQTGTNPNTQVSAERASTDRLDWKHDVPGGRVGFTDTTLHTSHPDSGYSCDTNTEGCVDGQAVLDPAGMFHEKHWGMSECDWEDYSDVTRAAQCGSVEPEQNYWVDVTVTQSIQLDLATPASCPETTPWGGGRDTTPGGQPLAEHPRFPFNAGCTGVDDENCVGDSILPINELTQTADHLTRYLPTCGGWQRDATYRFTAANWNVPQYVYLYAHNDKDGENSDPASGPSGGNDNSGDYWTLAGVDNGEDGDDEANENVDATAGDAIFQTLKHYVETEDTLDNMANEELFRVQRNKHGAQYTSGNKERYPFGLLTDFTAGDSTGASGDQPLTGVDSTQEAILTEPFGHRVTGFTTYGYSDYQQIYGYYEQEHTWTGAHIARVPCGAVHMGAGIGHAQVDGVLEGVGADDASTEGDEYVWTYATSDSADPNLGESTVLPKATAADGGTGAAAGPGWATGFVEPTFGEACLDPYDNQKPYTQDGKPCIPVRTAHPANAGDAATPGLSGAAVQETSFVRPEPVRASPGANIDGIMPSGPEDGPSAIIAGSDYSAEYSWPTTNTAPNAESNANEDAGAFNSGTESTYCVPKYATKNGGMFSEPQDVRVYVSDNDAISAQGVISPCKQTSLFSTSALGGTDTVTGGNMWLVDQNCANGDAGGLPGYPVAYSEVVGSESNVTPSLEYVGDAGVPGDDQCENGGSGPYCEVSE